VTEEEMQDLIDAAEAETAAAKLVINQLLWFFKRTAGLFDKDGILRDTGMTLATLNGVLADFAAYEQARSNRPAQVELAPNGHGPNQGTFLP